MGGQGIGFSNTKSDMLEMTVSQQNSNGDPIEKENVKREMHAGLSLGRIQKCNRALEGVGSQLNAVRYIKPVVLGSLLVTKTSLIVVYR